MREKRGKEGNKGKDKREREIDRDINLYTIYSYSYYDSRTIPYLLLLKNYLPYLLLLNRLYLLYMAYCCIISLWQRRSR